MRKKHGPGARVFAACLVFLATAALPNGVWAQADSTQGPPAAQGASPSEGYKSHSVLVQALNRLAQSHSNLVAVAELVRSPGGRAVHAVRVAAGAGVETRSALLIVANAWGPQLIGSEIALGTIEYLATSYGQVPAVTQLLDNHAVYVVPRANPDAAEVLFAGNMYERDRNDEPFDDDKDGTEDEDGPEDLNGDGMITLMRISDQGGAWLVDSIETDLVRRADRLAGERGMYRVEQEGVDSDRDGELNEDPLGGVNVNENFSYEYPYFGAAAGRHPLSTPEARAIAQLFVDRPSIAAVYVIGPQDNLMTPWKHTQTPGIGGNAQGTSAGGTLTSVLAGDEDYMRHVSDQFKSITRMTGHPASAALAGDVLSFSYYHMGRWAFGSRGWWIPEMDGMGEDAAARDRNAVRWVKANVPGGFVAWSAVQHPGFPGTRVEIGGLRPYVTINPPAAMIDSVVGAHVQFVVALGNMLPRLSFGEAKVESLGDRVYRITTRVFNNGYLPTASQIGVRVRWPRNVRLEVRGGPQSVLAGRAVELIGPIEGSGGSVERTWVVTGAPGSSVTIRASSPVAGDATQTVTLR